MSMHQAKSLSHDKLTDTVIREIQDMILRGEAQPASWLMPQPELAKRLGVGLSTVREAIKGLALLGILEPQPGRGTWIHPDALFLLRVLNLLRIRLENLNLGTLYEARRLLEVELAALAAQRATPQALERIEAALKQMQQALHDDRAFMEADLQFHLAVAQAAGNSLLERYYHITAEMMNQVNRQIATLPGIKDVGLHLQQDIFNAIREHNPRLARRSALALIQRWGKILRVFEAVSTDFNPDP